MFKSILVPVDGSALSYRPMQTAIEFARQNGGRLILLSVASPRLFNSSQPEALQDGRAAEARNTEAAKDNIRKAFARSGDPGVPWEGVISISGAPAVAILETAQRFQCDLILIGTRGKMGMVETLFNESTTQEILGKTRIPVLVFPDA